MNGEAFVGLLLFIFTPMKYIGGQLEKAVLGWACTVSLPPDNPHLRPGKNKPHKSYDSEGHILPWDFAFGIAVAYLFRSDMCLFVHSVRFSFFS